VRSSAADLVALGIRKIADTGWRRKALQDTERGKRMNELRKGMPPLPSKMQRLPIDERGYPIPWFVAEIDGKRDFRIADSGKRVRATKNRLCWICGEQLGTNLAFVIGPMCAINRNTSEPPCHRDCATFAVMACPFLILPKSQQRDANLPANYEQVPHGIPGNPGACAIWMTKNYRPYPVEGGNFLIRIGAPLEILWFCEGKPATRKQIMDSIDARLPNLTVLAEQQGPIAIDALKKQLRNTMALLPDA
jgi:hypothetical protein